MGKILKGKKFFTFEKWLACFTGILLVMIAIFSCNNMLVKDGGSLVIAMPGARAATASSFTIELTGTSGAPQSKTVAGGTTVQFDDLAPDTYSIVVKGMDASGSFVFYGTASATVVAGETATVTMELQKILGNLTVNFSETSGSTATNFTVTLTDSKNTTQSKNVASGSSVQFDNLVVGSYDISVKGTAGTDAIVLYGTSSTTVTAGKTVSVEVDLQEVVNTLENLKTAITAGGTVYIGSDIEVTETLQISNTVTILPAYQDVTLKNTGSGNLFGVSSGELTIGGREYTITLDGSENSSYVISAGAGCSVYLNENSIITKGFRGVNLGGGTSESSLSLAGGIITGNQNSGVYLGTKSQFNMSSGSITGNSTGVSVSADSQFSMTGGSISDNTTNGVDVIIGEFIMAGGSISGNTGEGVNVSGQFTMTGGSISGNTSNGVYVSGAFTMTGGSISGNTLSGVLANGQFTMTDGSISDNKSNGVCVYTGGNFTMSGSAVIASDNDVSLRQNTSITVSGELTGDAVATITPASYAASTQVLTAGDGVTLANEVGKFAVTPQSNGRKWTIDESGYLQEVGAQ